MMELFEDLRRSKTWSLHGKNGLVVSIDLASGDVVLGDHYTPSEAAIVFWEAVAACYINKVPAE